MNAKDFAKGDSGPRRMSLGTRVIKITLGTLLTGTIAFAQSTTTSVTTWGGNNNSQLGRANSPENMTAQPVPSLGAGVIAVATGSSHSLALKSDGTVLAWGNNASGQLGDGTLISKASPITVTGLGPGSGVIAIAAGNDHCLALKSNGAVVAWGSNSSGQLGDGTTTQRTAPVQVIAPVAVPTDPQKVIAVSAGLGSHSLALRANGMVLAWGSNNNGQLGDGTTTQRTSPVQVSTLGAGSGVDFIVAGGSDSFAHKAGGNVWSWGANSSGQLGDGTTTRKLTPVQLSGLGSGVIALAADFSHTMALKSDHSVWGWGNNSSGQIGDGTKTNRTSPVAVTVDPSAGGGPLTNVAAIAVGNGFSFAVTLDNSLLAWGADSVGQLGDGDANLAAKVFPTAVVGLASGSGVVAAAGGDAHALVVKSDGSVLSWGANSAGQLGKGVFDQPLPIDNFSDIDLVAAGSTGSHTLARKSDGSVWSWGMNTNGQLGNGGTTNQTTPVPVSGLGPNSNVVALAAGNSHSLALTNDGIVLAWGSNANGQLGNGTTSPTPVTTPVTLGFTTQDGVIAIAAGGSFSLALKSNGTVWAWGSNSSGQLGTGNFTQSTSPVQVLNLNGVHSIAAGSAFSIAVKSDRTVWAWGANSSGQLGDNTTIGKNTPVQVLAVSGAGGLTGITDVAAGSAHTLALDQDGHVFAWGMNANGQLGDGTQNNQRNRPVEITSLAGAGIVKLAGGASHSLGVKSNGDLWGWGANSNGQLGDGTLSDQSNPVQTLIRGGNTTAAGSVHSVAVTAPLPSDTTPPVITASVVGTAGNNGWYRSNVTVTWTITDAESTIASSTGCGPTTLTSETAGTTLTCSATNAASLTQSVSVTIKIDKTGPVVSITRTAANSNGWNKTAVVVDFVANDVLSGVDGSNTSQTTISTEGQSQSASATFTDQAGNATTSTASSINIDMTPPVVTFTRTAPNANGWNNTAVMVHFSATDNLSGIDGPATIDQTVSTDGQDQSVSATFTDLAGNSATSTAGGINVDTTPPVVTFTRTPTANANGWNKTAVVVHFSATDSESGIDGASTADRTVSTEGQNQSASATFVDLAGNSTTSNATGINIDMTPPVVTFTRTAPNGAGWNKTSVVVHFSATDNVSGIDGSATVDQTLSAEGQNQSTTATFSDLAGNIATSNAGDINIDLTAPTLQFGSASPGPNGAGWNNSNVSIGFTASDALSGVSSTSTSSPLVLSSEGTNVTGTVTVTDVAGNSASFVSPAANIDKTKPVASASQSPLPDSNGWNSTDVTITFTGTDSLSGVQVCSAPVVLTSNGANQSASGTCTDRAGNVSNPATINGININKNPNPTSPSISGLPPAGCTIWPPNKQMVQIADVTATGVVTGSLSVKVSSSEPVDTSDIVVNGGAVQVRADRNGSGIDRIYTVTAAATDAAGRPITASGSCVVPHDSSEKPTDSGTKKKK